MNEGLLGEHPLVELIHEIAAAGLSGALRLERERVKVVVYFELGEIVYAASNLRVHRLIEVARRAGVTDQQLARACNEEAAPDAKLGAALVETRILSAEALEKLLIRQTTEVLRPLLLWTSGTWQFNARARLVENMRVKINSRELMMEAARRLPEDFVAKRFPNSNEILFTEITTSSNEQAFLPTEVFVLSRVDVNARINEVIALSGLAESEALRVIYTLVGGGCLRRENPPRAFTPEEVAQALALQASIAAAKPGAPAAIDAASIVEANKSAEAKAQPVVQPEENEQAALNEMFARLARATNHYTMLGIGQRASPTEIKRAYHAHARRFHPDRFHSDADKTLPARVEAAFKQIGHAYETLSNKSTRAAYDLKLNAEVFAPRNAASPSASATPPMQHNAGSNTNQNTTARPSTESNPAQGKQPSFNNATQASPTAHDSSASSQAEHYFQQGLAALQQGNQALAAARLSEAARLEPRQPRYRAHYGRALATNAQMRHRAEAELKAAVELDAKDVSYRVMLAEFYRSIGLHRRAEGELERALAIDPQNENTRRLLNDLRASPKTTLRA